MRGGRSRADFDGVEEARGIISLRLCDARACRRIVECSKAARGWEPAHVEGSEEEGGSVVRREYRSAESFFPSERWAPKREFDRKIKGVVRPLVRRAWLADLKAVRDTHVVRYSPGGFYVPHIDTVPGEEYRYFTVLCYLNEDFEGGWTSFPLLNFSVRPRTGKAILFPSTYLHCAEPVGSGEKYVIVTWLTGPPPIRWL
jgi:hypothetical protein